MTVAEFFGCTFLAFGPPLAMFAFTIAHDPIRIIILVAAAFLWLCSLLLSSLIWFLFYPLRDFTPFGLIVSVGIQVNLFICAFHITLFNGISGLNSIVIYMNFVYVSNLQEIFRFGIYKILRKTEHGLQEVSDSVRVAENKHILAYVSGLGFGVMSGAFALVNILADAVSRFKFIYVIVLILSIYYWLYI